MKLLLSSEQPPKSPAVPGRVDYLLEKLSKIDTQLAQTPRKAEAFELYFQKGKLYAEMELMKRVPMYDE